MENADTEELETLETDDELEDFELVLVVAADVLDADAIATEATLETE